LADYNEKRSHCRRMRNLLKTQLRLSLSEAEVVTVIMDGLSSSQRSHLVFQKLPVTFGELDQVSIHDHNIRFGDRVRGQVVPSDYRIGINRRTEPSTGDIVAGVSATNQGQAGQKMCFYCNKVRDLRRSCRIRLDALKRAAPVEPTSVPPQRLAPRRNGIVGLRTFGLPRVTVQLGHLTIRALLDSGSVRSIISQEFS
jgi:hypothetical protein